MGVDMDVLKMIAELRAEKTAIDEALGVLERLAGTHGRRRGRPPAWLSTPDSGKASAEPKKRRVLSEDVRKKMAEGQRKRWAAHRKANPSES